MPSKFEVQVSADTRQAESQFRKFGDWLKTGFGIDIAGRLNQAFLQIPHYIEQALAVGVKFNSAMEDAELGLAGLLRAIAPDRFATLDAAIAGSAGLMRDLRKEAETTAATFGQLVEATQGLMGPALGAGIPLEKMAQLASMIARTVGTVMPGAPGFQIMQEGRALLTGELGPGAMIAGTIPGISKKAIDQARKAGRLFEFLQEKLGAFNEAAARGATTLTVLWSNLQDAFQGVAADSTTGLFGELKEFIKFLTALVKSEPFREAMKNMADISGAVLNGTVQKSPLLLEMFNQAVDLGKYMFAGGVIGRMFGEGISDAEIGALKGAAGWLNNRVGRGLAETLTLQPHPKAPPTPSGAATSGWGAAQAMGKESAKAMAEALKSMEFKAPSSALSRAGMFVTRAEAYLQRQGLQVQKSMLEELKAIRDALTSRGLKVEW